MKKYISIFMLTSVLGMVSCDRETANTEISAETMKNVELRDRHNQAEPATTQKGNMGLQPKDTGDDDPDDDKQHWRLPNDSIF